MDRLRSMEVFARVVSSGSFVAASEELGISRPMASKHVQELEADLGVRLLNRTTRRLSLTEAGSAFHLRCQSILADVEEAVSEAGNLQIEPSGLLRINAPLTFGRAHLARAIARFQSSHPQISVDLTLNDRVVDIVDEGYDLAIRIGNLADSSLIARKLAPCRLVLCASPSYLESHGTLAHPEDLKDHNCLIYAQSSLAKQWTFKGPGGAISVDVEGNLRTNFGEALVEAAAAGSGVVLEPSFTLAPYLASGKLMPILPEFVPEPLGIYAVYPTSRMLPQKVRAFIDHLVEVFGPEPYWDQAA